MGARFFVALYEESVRGTKTGSPLFLPVKGELLPVFTPEDLAREEFRGETTGLGHLSTSMVRRSSQWTHKLECAWYPGPETNLLLKHALGNTAARTVVDTSAYVGMIHPEVLPYGDGATLETKAIGLEINYDDGNGATVSRYYGGGRINSWDAKAEESGDYMLSFDFTAPGEFIGDVAAETAGASFPTVSPYTNDDILLYVGAGITRTGTGPAYTAIVPNTMKAFRPDSFTLTVSNGRTDKVQRDGVLGPNKTTFGGDMTIELNAPVDYSDSSSLFSSADEYFNIIGGPQTNSFLVVADNGEVAGATTEKYSCIIDLPDMTNNATGPSFKPNGETAIVDLNYSTNYDLTTTYPIGVLVTDQESTI